MPIFDLYSKRQRRARGEVSDVYTYDDLPTPLRVQILHIIDDAFASDYSSETVDAYALVVKALCREYGVFHLIPGRRDHRSELFEFFGQEENTERALDVIELCFSVATSPDRWDSREYFADKFKIGRDAVNELNLRFKEHAIGFRFEANHLIRIDSEYVHSEAVKPALVLLRQKGFAGANDEFLAAHEHYRHGRHKECLVDSLKALESTMKAICDQREWTPTKPTAAALIDCCADNGLFAKSYESQLSSLRTLLASGVPTVRNNMGGHGQGSEVVVVPEHVARYALNLAASNILFLVESNAALGK
ncbi:hypothetical protein [Rhodanobacter sp. L36]|uniref:STM4504/CBY_0614 family protein n=1 Tax=Rhodanobacter sp. L36 TaxID=1747221 RepID=UPI00131EC196|nr:hypothetical protein [Rhodanobacter sp. L36]